MQVRRLAAPLGCVLVLGAAAARGEPRAEPPRTDARSVGSPTNGMLQGGVPLRERAELRLRWPEGPRWALPDLVTLLERAAQRVEARFPGSILLVGDLSRREGGSLFGHVSHESGRDADVAFYYTDPQGNSVRTDRLLPVGPTGAVQVDARLRFDEARNWALVEAFLTDRQAVVQRIFVADSVRHRLLQHARQKGVRARLVARAEAVLRDPGAGPPHDDHFHVRIACPPGQRAFCVPGAAPSARPIPSPSREASLR